MISYISSIINTLNRGLTCFAMYLDIISFSKSSLPSVDESEVISKKRRIIRMENVN